MIKLKVRQLREVFETVDSFLDDGKDVTVSKDINTFYISYDTVKDGYEGTFTIKLVIV